MFGKVTGFMSNDQVATDTAALQNYISQMKALKDDAERAAQKQNLINSALKDSSQVAKDVAQNTNNLDDVMKVYTASTRTATSVAKAFGKALLGTIATAAVAAVIGYVVKSLATQIDNVVHAYENARDKVSEMNQKHEEATQKVEDLTQKIEELKAKIDECKDSTTGNPVDPESYDALEQQRKQLQTNLDLQKAMAESAAHNTREAVYAQQDTSSTKIISAPATVKSAGISGIYQGNQHERLQQAMDDYKTLASAIENLDSDLANGKIIQAVYDTRLAAFKEFQKKLQDYIKESGDDLNTEMDTLLNNATNEQSTDADKTKYQERIKVLSDTQQAFLNFWNLYYNNIPLITQATDDFTRSVTDGEDSVKALNDAINSGEDICHADQCYLQR